MLEVLDRRYKSLGSSTVVTLFKIIFVVNVFKKKKNLSIPLYPIYCERMKWAPQQLGYLQYSSFDNVGEN